MRNSVIFKELLELALESDYVQSDLDALFDSMQLYLKELAAGLHIAKIEVHYIEESDIYDIGGSERVYEAVYDDAPMSEDNALTVRYNDEKCKYTVFYPCTDHEWTSNELRDISVVSNLILMAFCRVSMAKRHDKAPYTDSMTGLLNHPGLRRYGADIESRYLIEDYVGCFLRIENFKYINQQFGHGIADEVICRYALTLYENSDHDKELIARLGAASFFALIRKERLNGFLELVSNMRTNIQSGDETVDMPINTRIGICPADSGDKVSRLITRSSFSVEQAKSDKVDISYYNKDKMDVSVHRKKVIHILPEAIKNGEIVPFYQPKVHLDSGLLYGCEALARWKHDGQTISPMDFILVAEDSGLITALDLYMLEAVCRDIRSWIDSGIEPVCVSVNYSQRNFYRDTLIRDTLDIIKKYDIDGKYLEFEITESSFIENVDALKNFIKVMHDNGIRVSLDDFGTGYSSLKMFSSLDLDAVKLDKSLFDSISEDDRKCRMILRSIADMISQIDTITIAEGIETDEQLKFVHEIGGHVVQGFIFDKPLDRDEFTKRLSEKSYEHFLDRVRV